MVGRHRVAEVEVLDEDVERGVDGGSMRVEIGVVGDIGKKGDIEACDACVEEIGVLVVMKDSE